MSIGPYKIYGRQLGKGSFSTVYEAKKSDKNVAMKLIKDDYIKNFKSEKYILSKLIQKHENIIKLMDIYEKVVNENKYYVIIYPYYEYNLFDYIDKNTLKVNQVKFITKCLIKGLIELNNNKILHADLKPANILLKVNNTNIINVVICDFSNSLEYSYAEINDYSENPICTSWYRPPEQIINNTYTKTKGDIWSLGCVLFEMVCKKFLFDCSPESKDCKNLVLLHNFQSLIGSIPYVDNKYFTSDKILKPLTLIKENLYILEKWSLSVFFLVNLNKLYNKQEALCFSNYFLMIKKCLQFVPDERINLEDLLKHDWFNEILIVKTNYEMKRKADEIN